MDIAKIIASSCDKAMKSAANSEFLDETPDSLTQTDTLLINYSNILIAAYHEELKKVLAEQGITI